MVKVAKVRRGSSSNGVLSPRKDPDLSLPDSPNEPPDSLDDVIIMIYGRKNIGKSSLAAQFESNLTMMFEEGRKNLSIFQVPKKGEPSLTWERALKYRDMVCDSDQFQRIAIDTVDQAYQRCFEYVCRQDGVRHPDESNKPYMLWQAIVAEFKEFVLSFREAGKGVTFVSHEKIKPLITKAKGLIRLGSDADGSQQASIKLDRIEPSCTGQVMGVITEICDYVFYYHYYEGKRAIMVRSPQDIAWTACGMGETFCDPDGTPIERFEAGSHPTKAYEAILSAFNNELRDMDYIPPPSERVSSLGKNKKKTSRK